MDGQNLPQIHRHHSLAPLKIRKYIWNIKHSFFLLLCVAYSDYLIPTNEPRTIFGHEEKKMGMQYKMANISFEFTASMANSFSDHFLSILALPSASSVAILYIRENEISRYCVIRLEAYGIKSVCCFSFFLTHEEVLHGLMLLNGYPLLQLHQIIKGYELQTQPNFSIF